MFKTVNQVITLFLVLTFALITFLDPRNLLSYLLCPPIIGFRSCLI